MSDTKSIVIQEVRAFFKRISWKKILTFLFFVLLSSIFWMMQIYRQKFETTLYIPIKYTNIPDSILFENDFPKGINVRIRDDGAALFKYYFTKRKDSIRINVEEMLKEPLDNAVPEMIRLKLFGSSEIKSYYPAQIAFTHTALHQKKIPVIYDGHISLPSGYMIDGDISITPDSVMAYGSKAALDTLFFAHTSSDTLYNVTSDKKVVVMMEGLRGIKYIPNKVELSVPVDEFALKEIEVPITCINLPQNLNIKFFPSSVKIPFFVGLKRYNSINENSFQIKIDYNEIKDLKGTSIPIRITESPDYIRAKVPIPSEVEFILEQE